MLKGLRHVPRPDAASGLSDAGMASPFGVLGVTLATPNALPSSLPPPYSPPTPSLLLIPSSLLPLLVYIFILLFLHTPYSSLSRSSYFTLVQIFLFLLKIIICITRILLPSSYCLIKSPSPLASHPRPAAPNTSVISPRRPSVYLFYVNTTPLTLITGDATVKKLFSLIVMSFIPL